MTLPIEEVRSWPGFKSRLLQTKNLYGLLTYLTNKKMFKKNVIEMRTVKITEKGQIAIPNDIRRLEGFKKGSKIAILAYKDRIELRPLKKLNKNVFGLLVSEKTLAKDWLSKEEDELWKNL